MDKQPELPMAAQDVAVEMLDDAAEVTIDNDLGELKKEYERYYRTDNPLADLHLERYTSLINTIDPIKYIGRVRNVTGLIIEGCGPEASIGELCKIRVSPRREVLAEVVGFSSTSVKLMTIGSMDGIAPGCTITATGSPLYIPVGDQLIGRVLNGIGEPIDDKGDVHGTDYISIMGRPSNVLRRKRVTEALSVGVKAIDSMFTAGRGQRMGIFSGSGVGKSTLISMMARNTEADVNVVALVGERGKEVRDFLERDLGPEGLAKSVVVVATSNEEPLLRLRAAFVATSIAEYFRDRGKNVLLLMDSLTRFAHAQRDVGLSAGEPPTRGGYTPSVSSVLSKLIERAGTSHKGTITAFYSVLVEGDDDVNDPVADAARGYLDGHIVLSRDLAMRNHFPAIDVLASISRAMVELVDEGHLQAAGKAREILKEYNDKKDLIDVGAYARGSNPRTDFAIAMVDRVNDFLKQGINETVTMEESVNRLKSLFVTDERLLRKTRAGRMKR